MLGSQYFLFFGVLGIFLPYFNLYCYHIGFSGFQIGILSGLRSMILVLFSLIWSALADRFQIRKPLYILCHFLSTTLWIFYIFTSDFLQMLVITFFFGILMLIAYEIYFNPQVYVFNPFIGFFPGTIYDEGISVSGKLILY
ncbi:MAG: MFS transporter, partial [Desulfobacterales bacterium]